MTTKNHHPQEEEVLKAQQEEASEQTETQTEETSNTEEQCKEPSAEQKLEKELEGIYKKRTIDKEMNMEIRKVIEDQKDKYLRLSAEFDNYRKRTMKEKAELIKNGGEKAISAILPILDDLERALQNMQKADNVQAMYEGIDLISQKFLKVLAQEGLQKMEPVGETFDTDFHEAIALVPAPDETQKGKVLDCVQTGYKLNDKVIRHAKVVVAQ